MFCKNCGNKFQGEEKFCAKCGNAKPAGEQSVDQTLENDKKLTGLNGWLTVVLLGLLYTLYNYGSAAISSSKMFTDGTVEQVSHIQGYAGALGFEVILQFLFAFATIFLLFLFFKKKRQFPKFYIIFLIANVIFILIDNSIMSSLNFPTEIQEAMQEIIDEGSAELWKAIISGGIWIWYMRVSKRVKLTFVE